MQQAKRAAAEKKAEDAKRSAAEKRGKQLQQKKKKSKRNKDPHSLQKIDLKERMTIL
jgi:hypothetical protein